ncbi:MAG: AAA-like domain-containing protein [Chloroflexi bacterium]|nr:AAA-like domain-containing protein [Chloroflexota bacterium]
MKFFNTAGPCRPEYHYMLPAAARLREENVMRLIETQSYFVVHAPRQTGKTTAMLGLAQELTASGKYTAAMLTLELGAGLPDDLGGAERAILADWRQSIAHDLPPELHPPPWPKSEEGQQISAALNAWALHSQRALVVLLDEIDALQNHVLISVLRQLRAGYPRRPRSFPAALALIGLRDVRDYKVKSGGSPHQGTTSPFNIAVRSITLRNFTEGEVAALLQQHTAETGQPFTPEALAHVWHLTRGQPWLVNALAKVAVEELVNALQQPVDVPDIDAAKELLILRRQTHLDQLTDKLREPRVRHVIEPLLAGASLNNIPLDDLEYVTDLGLITREYGGVRIANPIYQEVIPRTLTIIPEASLPTIHPTWLTADNQLDPDRLLAAFLDFWRQHGQPLLKSAPYHEIAPHLVLMAFLHRVMNGNGTIEREYAIGSRRMDLLVRYGPVRLALELKVWRDGVKDPAVEGLGQLDSYLDGLGLPTGWLVIFDQRSGLPEIAERVTTEQATTPAGRVVTVIRA